MKPIAKTTDQIAISRSTSTSLAEKMYCLFDRVRRRAYELFEQRGRVNGHDLDDWLQAENELGILPAAKIDESETEISLRIDRANFTAEELKVNVEQRAITVQGASIETRESGEGLHSTTREHNWFGSYELPAAINTDLVTATLDNGVLEIVARKAEAPAAQSSEDTAKATPVKPKSEKEKSAAA